VFKIIVFLMFLSVQSLAQKAPNSVPAVKAFESSIVISVFNIQKSENSGWREELFKKLVESSDLILIQESIDRFGTYKFEDTNYIDHFYKSWANQSYNTGLSTLTRVPFDESKRIVSEDTEPVAATPKVTSIEKYALQGRSEKLLVVNTHGINFTGLSAFKRQMSAVAKELKSHQGPMVWAGDFNTWSKRRKLYLDSVMKSLNLRQVQFRGRSERFLVLDHAFVRGVDVSEAVQLQLSISDHEPLKFRIEF